MPEAFAGKGVKPEKVEIDGHDDPECTMPAEEKDLADGGLIDLDKKTLCRLEGLKNSADDKPHGDATFSERNEVKAPERLADEQTVTLQDLQCELTR